LPKYVLLLTIIFFQFYAAILSIKLSKYKGFFWIGWIFAIAYILRASVRMLSLFFIEVNFPFLTPDNLIQATTAFTTLLIIVGIHYLIQTRQKINELEQKNDDLVHTINHDIKNILNRVNISLQLIAEKKLGSLTNHQHQKISSVMAGIFRMKILIKNLAESKQLTDKIFPINQTKIDNESPRSRAARYQI